MAIDSTMDGSASVRPGLSRVIIAATIGNVLEIFDFIVYGFFAVTIAEVFFPASNPTVSLLVTFGTFGLGYVVRPLACPYGSAPLPFHMMTRRNGVRQNKSMSFIKPTCGIDF